MCEDLFCFVFLTNVYKPRTRTTTYILKITCVEKCSFSFTHEKVKNVFSGTFFFFQKSFFNRFSQIYGAFFYRKVLIKRNFNVFHGWKKFLLDI